mmetsp:Transcript_17170/g.17081  ORF Transcript_17170/g.17081 Transcript_17170/m.17081 type:complete len:205 (-) Transcript_17170:36-650(-)
MEFGALNGASDGSLLMGLMMFALGIIGPDYFTGNYNEDIKYRDIVFVVVLSSAVAISVLNVYNVLQVSRKYEPYLKTFSFFYISSALLLAIFLSPSNLWYYAGREVGLCIGFVFAKEIALIQIAHVTNTKYKPLQWANFVIISGMILNTLTHAYGINIFDEYRAQLVLAIASFLNYAHLAIYLPLEFAEILEIPIFRVPREKQT